MRGSPLHLRLCLRSIYVMVSTIVVSNPVSAISQAICRLSRCSEKHPTRRLSAADGPQAWIENVQFTQDLHY